MQFFSWFWVFFHYFLIKCGPIFLCYQDGILYVNLRARCYLLHILLAKTMGWKMKIPGQKHIFLTLFYFFAEKLLNLHVLPQQHELCNFLLQYHSLCTLLASKLGWKIHFKNINIYFSWYWEFLAFFPVKNALIFMCYQASLVYFQLRAGCYFLHTLSANIWWWKMEIPGQKRNIHLFCLIELLILHVLSWFYDKCHFLFNLIHYVP